MKRWRLSASVEPVLMGFGVPDCSILSPDELIEASEKLAVARLE
jgi:hypothetical protein